MSTAADLKAALAEAAAHIDDLRVEYETVAEMLVEYRASLESAVEVPDGWVVMDLTLTRDGDTWPFIVVKPEDCPFGGPGAPEATVVL